MRKIGWNGKYKGKVGLQSCKINHMTPLKAKVCGLILLIFIILLLPAEDILI